MSEKKQPTSRQEWVNRLLPIVHENPEAVLQFAARAALRALPLIVDLNGNWLLKEGAHKHALAICRAARFAWYNVIGSDAVKAANVALNLAYDFNQSAVSIAKSSNALHAAHAVGHALYAGNLGNINNSVHEAAQAAIYANSSDNDVKKIQQGIVIRSQPLWVEGIPELMQRYVSTFKTALSNIGLGDFATEYQWWLDGNIDELDKQPLDKYEARWQAWSGEDSEQYDESADVDVVENDQSDNSALTDQKPRAEEAGVTTHTNPASFYQFGPGARINHETIATEDHLNRIQTAEALSQWLTEQDNTGHLALGLFGDWGAGKSTFVELLRQKLNVNRRPDHLFDRICRFWNGSRNQMRQNDQPVDFIYGEFNAWHYEHSDNIQAGVAQEAVTGLTYGMKYRQKWWLTFKFSARAHTARLTGVLLLAAILAALPFLSFEIADLKLLPKELSTILEGQKWPLMIVSVLGLIGLIGTQYKKLIAHPLAEEFNTYLRLPHFGKHMGMIPVMREQLGLLARLRLTRKSQRKTLRYLFVVDDLDRCSSEGVVKTLEAIKLVMDLDHVVVLIAIDQRIALASLAEHYSTRSKQLDDDPLSIARDYLGKIIHVPITLEEPSDKEVDGFLEQNLWAKHEAIPEQVTNGPAEPEDNSDAQPLEADIVASEELPPDDEANAADATGAAAPPTSPDPDASNDADNSKQFEPPKQLQGLSKRQKGLFKTWTTKLQLRNPRQLKRLHNTYAFLRLRYPQEDEVITSSADVIDDVMNMTEDGTNHPRLLMLLWLEYVNDLDAERRKALLAHIQAEPAAESESETSEAEESKSPEDRDADAALWQDVQQTLQNTDIQRIYVQVKNFVLPAWD